MNKFNLLMKLIYIIYKFNFLTIILYKINKKTNNKTNKKVLYN